eukprot:1521021-Karenia_brevis.AAC.1
MSRAYAIERGTKQGDPLSPPLFNAVFEEVMGNIQTAWRRQGFGIQLKQGDTKTLTIYVLQTTSF